MSQRKPFDVFLSHNSIDKPWVVQLKKALDEHGLKAWLDVDEIRPGKRFPEEVERGIKKSSSVAIVVPPEAIKSGWVKQEFYTALALATSAGAPVIPVLLRDAKIPAFLKTLHWVDFRDPANFEESVNRLVWGITGKRERKQQPQPRDVEAGERAGQGLAPVEPKRRPSADRIAPWPELEMVKIEPGTFLMGSPDSEAGRARDEGPQTQVTITTGFWMGKYAVTHGQYEAVMETNPSHFKGSRYLPVESVSWEDATDFCTRLTEQEGKAGRLPVGHAYRLPTEAEWEYACRAGTTRRFSFGDDPELSELGNHAWYSKNSSGTTHPVGEKAPNPWGLHDMRGNVWEWCLDWKADYPGGALTGPTGPAQGERRVLRGGSCSSDGEFCRPAYRGDYLPSFRIIDFGFRVVLAPRSGTPGQAR